MGNEDITLRLTASIGSDGKVEASATRIFPTDLPGRLRCEVTIGSGQVTPLRREAADRIEAQAAEIERLREALRVIGFSKLSLSPQADEENRRHARAALHGEGQSHD